MAQARQAAVWCLLAAGALAAGAAACGSSGTAPVPVAPTYATDVRPILLQHCVRCHGAGGTLNVDPTSTAQTPPPNGYFDHYEDQGDCTPGDGGALPATCKQGAASLAPGMATLVDNDEMPPAPAPLLSTHDRQVIDRWAAETPPLP
jgi:hypothetical protein